MRLLTVSLCLFFSSLGGCAAGQPQPGQPTVAADGRQVILPQEQQVIPPQKMFERTIELYGAADLDLVFEIEAGKSLDIFVMTDEQEKRYAAGQMGDVLGTDFLRVDRAVMASGNVVTRVQPGRHAFIFQNASDQPVTLTSTVLAKPL